VSLRRHLDLVLAVALAILGILELSEHPEVDEVTVAGVAGVLLMTLPIALRRTRPALATPAVLSGAVLVAAVAAPPLNMFFGSGVITVLAYSLGRYTDGRARIVLLTATAVVFFVDIAVADSVFDAFYAIFIVGAAAGGGLLVRGHVATTRELAERTHELEALRDASERDAMLDERRRIARELHDVVAHTVSVMVVQAGGARVQAERDPERAIAALDQVDGTGREALRELDLLFGLLETPDVDRGLAHLPALVARAGLPVELRTSGEPRELDAVADLALYRVVQEALTNTIKHGGPGAAATVEARWQDDGVEITVADTGWGVDGRRGEGSRRGLEGMRERLGALGGEVQAGPRAGGGFEVRARLPLRAREEVPA
jgi:signal transduction histidine kinase